jgi:signal transduction histidine kinase
LKLITKSTYYFFLFSIVAMMGGGVFLYYAIRKDIYKQIDNSLLTENDIIRDQIEETETVPDSTVTFDSQIEAMIYSYPLKKVQFIKDTVLYNSESEEYVPFRYLFHSGNTIKKNGYTIRLFQALTEKQDLLRAISWYMFGLFLSLFIISILINYLISKRLWHPFYISVGKAENFDVLSDSPLDLPDTDIIEFQQLNSVFENMTRKMRIDYLNLKEYNENAAHEIQTPLAVIRSKVELLIQNKNIKKESLDLIKSINEATTRLFKLNQGLLLISKIENQYFHENKRVSLKEKIESFLDSYHEIMEIKGIRVEVTATDQAVVEMNDVLADVLISNLLSNSVRYNVENGFIKCHIDNENLTITNSGQPLKTDPELLFRRFNKGGDNPQSVGLGLSIVKKITENYRMTINYSYSENIHTVRLKYAGI